MKTDPVATVRNSGIAAAFVAILVSYTGPAVGASRDDCSTRPNDRITTCLLDLTATHSAVQRGGRFVGTSADLGTRTGTPLSAGLLKFASNQQRAGDHLQSARDMGIRMRHGSLRLGDIARVSICDRRGDSRHCARYYEFQLAANERADGANHSVSPDKIKVVTSSSNGANSSPPDEIDERLKGNVSELANSDKPDRNGDFQALIPASSFSQLPDDTFVYVHTTFTGNGKCQDAPGASTCPQGGLLPDVRLPEPAAGGRPLAGAVPAPLPSTALLLGIGLVGMARMRRRRSPDLGVSH